MWIFEIHYLFLSCRSICFQRMSFCSSYSILFWFPTLLFDFRNPHGYNFFPWLLKMHWYALFINQKRNIFPGEAPGFPPMKAGSCVVKDMLFNLISCHLLNFFSFYYTFSREPWYQPFLCHCGDMKNVVMPNFEVPAKYIPWNLYYSNTHGTLTIVP